MLQAFEAFHEATLTRTTFERLLIFKIIGRSKMTFKTFNFTHVTPFVNAETILRGKGGYNSENSKEIVEEFPKITKFSSMLQKCA